MKTVKALKTNGSSGMKMHYKRASDKLAENLVLVFGWEYCPKSEWRDKLKERKDNESERDREADRNPI